jgi:prolyl-tRNA synthetase
MPLVVVAGRGVANGVVEVRNRVTGTTTEVAIDTAANHAVAELAKA